MPLKFDVREDGNNYILRTVTDDETQIEVRASDRELRRLLIDLVHTLDYDGQTFHIPSEDE